MVCQLFSVDFGGIRVDPFRIHLQKVTWLGSDADTPNHIVTCYLRSYEYGRSADSEVMIQLKTESLIGGKIDPWCYEAIRQALSALCALVRARLFPQAPCLGGGLFCFLLQLDSADIGAWAGEMPARPLSMPGRSG